MACALILLKRKIIPINTKISTSEPITAIDEDELPDPLFAIFRNGVFPLKKIFIVILTVFIFTPAYSQLYIRAGGGYNVSLAGAEIGLQHNDFPGGQTLEIMYGSYGAGLHFETAFGVMVSEHIAAEIGIGYLIGADHKFEESRENTGYTYHGTLNMTSTLFSISPAVTISTEIGGVKPYSRFSVIVGIPHKTREGNSTEMSNGIRSTTSFEDTDLGGLALGFSGALGVMMPIGPIMVYGEVRAISMGWRPEKSRYTSDSGTFETDYETKKTWYESTSSGEGIMVQPTIPFGSVGANIGVLFNL